MAYEASFEYNGAEGYTFSRNVYDRGRKYVGIWTGDAAVSFTGMSDALKQMIRLGNIMMPMAGSDTGGYNSPPTKELFARWIAMNAHVPYMEILLGPNRTPWNPPFTTAPNNVAPLLTSIFTKWTQEHHDMIPYTRSWLKHASQYGMPVIRALPLVYPDDPAVADLANQYMFGDALLVAPILPAGNWTDYNDKLTRYTGPATVTAAAPLDVVPRFVKAGSIIPRGDIIKSNNNWTPNWAPNMHIEFFPAQGMNSTFSYYTGTSVVPMIGGMFGNFVKLYFGNLGVDGKLEVYNIPGFTSVVRNGQTLTAGTDFQYDAAAQRLVLGGDGRLAVEPAGLRGRAG